jgi:hypothetical protein
VIRLAPPPPPANCRPAPEPPDKIEAVSRYHHYREERELRDTFYISLEESLAGVRGCARPRQRLYGGTLDSVIREWENRWWTGRLIELSFFSISELLTRLGRGISCRRPGMPPPEYLLAWLIGAKVHRRIQRAYRRAYPLSEVSLDNRVSRSAVARSERLSHLAYRDPASIYGALNFSLAGQRCDIIDFTRDQVWEIKPAALASEATLQLWAYLDNYEVARVFERCTRRRDLPPLHAGSPPSLSPKVTEEFTISFLKGRIQLVVQPFTISRLPGLILYTLRPKDSRRPRQRAQAQAMVAEGRVQLQHLLRAAGRSAQEQMEAEIAYWENAQYIATGVLVTCIAVELALAPFALSAAAAGGAGAAPKSPPLRLSRWPPGGEHWRLRVRPSPRWRSAPPRSSSSAPAANS